MMNKGISSDSRYNELDNAKGFLIFCVVFGHVLQRVLGNSFLAPRIQFWIYLFHMPAFIFIAGLFAKKTVHSRRFKKVFEYLILYVFMKALIYFSDIYVKGINKAEFKIFNENGIPWFSLSMVWWHLMVMMVANMPKSAAVFLTITAAVVVGYIPLNGSFLAVLRTINFFPFFYLGYITDINGLIYKLRKRNIQFVGLSVLLVSLLTVVVLYDNNKSYMKLFRGAYLYSETGRTFFNNCGGCARLIALLISFLMLLSLMAACSVRDTIFAYVGKYTLQIFVFHGPLISVLLDKKNVIKTFFPYNLLVPAFIISILIVFIILHPVFGHIVQNVFEIPGIIMGLFDSNKK